MLLNKNNIVHFYVQYVQFSSSRCFLCGGWGSEVEKVDKVLRRKGHGATFWVVGRAGMVCVLPEKDVAVCAEVQGVTVLLSVRIAAAQLKVHLLPLQVTFI